MSWIDRENADRASMHRGREREESDKALATMRERWQFAKQDAEWHRQALESSNRQLTAAHLLIEGLNEQVRGLHGIPMFHAS